MIQHIPMNYRYLFGFLLFFALTAGVLFAQTESDLPVELNQEDFLDTVDNIITTETDKLTVLENRVIHLKTLQNAVLIETSAYNIQNIVHDNLLLQPETSIAALEKAHNDNQSALTAINTQLKDFVQTQNRDIALQQQTSEHVTLRTNQARDIEISALSAAEKKAISTPLRHLDRILAAKLQALQTLVAGYDSLIKQLRAVEESTTQLNKKLDAQLNTRKTKVLFSKKPILTTLFKKGGIAGEFSLLTAILTKPFQDDFFTGNGDRPQETTAVLLLLVVFLITLATGLTLRFRRFLNRYEEKHPSVATHRWRLILVKLLQRSLIILGALFVLYGYDLLKFTLPPFPFHQPVASLLLIVLFSRWLMDYLKIRQPGATVLVPEELVPRVTKTITLVCIFSFFYLVVYWVLGNESVILFLSRLLLETVLLVCGITFWRSMQNVNRPIIEKYPTSKIFSYYFLMVLTYVITMGGIAIELAGYPALSFYWFLSWVRSLIIFFWALVLFNVIVEWSGDYFPARPSSSFTPAVTDYPVRRTFISISWLLWTAGLVTGLILAWNTQPNIKAGIYTVFNRSLPIGKINLNFFNLLLAVLILYLNLIVTRLGRYYITKKLTQRQLEPGLQGSITMITTYVMWGLSLILALSVLGISTTSMVVAFGALGVGLGFGLQAIFNNFISGIILLFERPIQVGDDVEINGTWAMVKKINVRATVVQTYDNASLIIPNSEFISSVVKNWSFKDRRLRRDIVVGVAYGSDIDLVRKTLLEIADKNPNALKYPRPDVVFDDFGDSALIFRLRLWTDIDNMITVTTDIRFKIDRIFREQGIEIAFPQQDIHIRSVEDDAKEQLNRKPRDDGEEAS